MKCLRYFIIGMLMAIALLMVTPAHARKNSDQHVKFYNFDEILIDGEIKKPTGLLTDVRKRARFNRLMNLQKSFIPNLMDTAKEKRIK